MSIELLEEDEDAELKEQKKKHEDFLLAEYSSITTAYSNTISTIATFFRNYLVIVGLPIPILGFVLTQLSKPGAPGQAATISLSTDMYFLVPLAGFVIGAIGFCLMIYVVNLRLDALLYARTVNGVRKYFYDKSPLEYEKELQMRVLPRTVTQPRYLERMYFLPVIGVFTTLNTLYPIVGIAWFAQGKVGLSPDEVWYAYVILFLLSLILHAGTYAYWAWYRETKHLRKFIIGVDIDGVLNKHRDTFCTKLYTLLGKEGIWAENITAIPVQDEPRIGVSEAEANAVFNHPSYWQDQVPTDGVAEVIDKLRNVFGYKVFIFTHRHWPERKQFPAGQEKQYRSLWRRAWFWWPRPSSIRPESRSWWNRTKLWISLILPTMHSLLRPLSSGSIRSLTIKWLNLQRIGYDKLVIEKGNVHTAGPNLLRKRNRFSISEDSEIRIFVEDDLFKAVKLANVCEVVFLIDHPYNRVEKLPRNVIRVSSWKDIYKYIREKL
ncbi:MAG: hypothetical protein K8U57_28395 [Planctomycetes bacterium]|nr:hypothetical protein [Planctomycetota bacterium]